MLGTIADRNHTVSVDLSGLQPLREGRRSSTVRKYWPTESAHATGWRDGAQDAGRGQTLSSAPGGDAHGHPDRGPAEGRVLAVNVTETGPARAGTGGTRRRRRRRSPNANGLSPTSVAGPVSDRLSRPVT